MKLYMHEQNDEQFLKVEFEQGDILQCIMPSSDFHSYRGVEHAIAQSFVAMFLKRFPSFDHREQNAVSKSDQNDEARKLETDEIWEKFSYRWVEPAQLQNDELY